MDSKSLIKLRLFTSGYGNEAKARKDSIINSTLYYILIPANSIRLYKVNLPRSGAVSSILINRSVNCSRVILYIKLKRNRLRYLKPRELERRLYR